MIHYRIRISIILLLVFVSAAPAQRQMENLTRGIVAVKQADGGVYIGWRLFGTDPYTVASIYIALAEAANLSKSMKHQLLAPRTILIEEPTLMSRSSTSCGRC